MIGRKQLTKPGIKGIMHWCKRESVGMVDKHV